MVFVLSGDMRKADDTGQRFLAASDSRDRMLEERNENTKQNTRAMDMRVPNG